VNHVHLPKNDTRSLAGLQGVALGQALLDVRGQFLLAGDARAAPADEAGAVDQQDRGIAGDSPLPRDRSVLTVGPAAPGALIGRSQIAAKS
jgi:hypothetical protein